MRKLTLVHAAMFSAMLALAACNSAAPSKPAPAPKPAEYLTGREAFQKLYVSAHAVAGDVKPYRMESRYTKGSPASEGQSGLWRADFARGSSYFESTVGGGRQTLPMTTSLLSTEAALGEAIFH